MGNIYFHSERNKCLIKGKRDIKSWIKKVIEDHRKKIGEINIIFTDDKDLLEINRSYLNHNFYTDTVTFNYNSGSNISGDIFISTDRIRENSKTYQTDVREEVLRVIIHGILHLLGYDDKSKSQINIMVTKEDNALKLFFDSFER